MAQVKQEFVGFRPDSSTEDTRADEAESLALEAAMKVLADKLEVILKRQRPHVDPPETHLDDR